jgi:hypothetical protein
MKRIILISMLTLLAAGGFAILQMDEKDARHTVGLNENNSYSGVPPTGGSMVEEGRRPSVQTPEKSSQGRDDEKMNEFMNKGAQLLENAKKRDADFAAKMQEWEMRLPFRAALRQKVSETKLEKVRPVLNEWGFSEQQISEIEGIWSHRSNVLAELRQKRLVEPELSRRRSLSNQSKKVDEEARLELRQILGDSRLAEFEAIQNEN